MYTKRFLRLILSMPVFALGAAMSIQSGIGVNAWDTFALGVANVTPFQYGTVVLITGLVVLVVDILMKQPIGFGTLMDILIIGKTTDLFLYLGFIPKMNSLVSSVILLVISLFIQSFGVYLYSGAGLSVGPRDAMLFALVKKFNVPVGVMKGIIEGIVFIIGLCLGAPVGIGTLICVFGVGFILQFTFKVFHFDLRNVHQENLIDTTKHLLHKEAHYE